MSGTRFIKLKSLRNDVLARESRLKHGISGVAAYIRFCHKNEYIW